MVAPAHMDDWGGFFDHELPPTIDHNGYGIRVPGLVISPWAKYCTVDKQAMSFDAYDKFIEDDFLGGERLDPTTDGRPDARNTPQPIPRETAMPTATLGAESDLKYDFNFNRTIFPTPPPLYPVTAVTPGATAYPTPDAAWCQS